MRYEMYLVHTLLKQRVDELENIYSMQYFVYSMQYFVYSMQYINHDFEIKIMYQVQWKIKERNKQN